MLSIDSPCDRRIVSHNVGLLNEMGIEVLETWVGKSKAYYIEDRSFSNPELKILIDVVRIDSFVTDKKIEELIDMLVQHKAEILMSNLVCFNTRKHSNEQIYYNVGAWRMPCHHLQFQA